MKTVRINSKNSPVSRSLNAFPNRFLNYKDLVADVRKKEEMKKIYEAERIIILSNSSGKVPVYMIVRSSVKVEFKAFNPEMGLSFMVPSIIGIESRKVNFYCINENKQLEEVKASFKYNGKTHSYDELTQVANFNPNFIYDDSSLGIAAYRCRYTSQDYKPTIKPFTERFAA